MGCISSKLARSDFKQERFFGNGDFSNHIVSLTSTTYGVLQLDAQDPIRDTKKSPPPSAFSSAIIPKIQKEGFEEPEIINTWELMEDLDDEIPTCSQLKRTPKTHLEKNTSLPLNLFKTPKKQKPFVGKENRHRNGGFDGGGRSDSKAKQVLRPFSPLENIKRPVPLTTSKILSNSIHTPLVDLKTRCHGNSSSRRSLSPLFDPELVASFERELSKEGEQIKKMVSPVHKSRRSQISESMLELFGKKCPPGGESAVVLYTTTLRGIRKTFEDCNSVRSAIESHGIRMMERDISMDSGFREELRVLMGRKEVRVPVVFVKGRLIGGVEEVLKLDEEGKLGILFEGIPRAAAVCEGCGGVRFVMCIGCSGSCKVLDEEQKKMVRCGECNENGLIQCPICC